MKATGKEFNAAAETIKNLGLWNPPRRPGRWAGDCPFCHTKGGFMMLVRSGGERGLADFHCFGCGSDGRIGPKKHLDNGAKIG